jgi:hypothetical protein
LTAAAAAIAEEITGEEMLEELKKQGSRSAVCNLSAKKRFATRLFQLKRVVKADIAAADPSGAFGLEGKMDIIFTAWAGKNRINKMSNDEHAAILVSLIECGEILHDHFQRIRDDSGVQTRNQRDDISLQEVLYKDLVELKHKVDLAVVSTRDVKRFEGSTLMKGLKLLPAMIGRCFDPAYKPDEEELQRCPWCNHCTLMRVQEDEGAEQRNDAKMEQYDQTLEIWERFVATREVANNAGRAPPAWPMNPFTGKEMKRAPVQLTNKQLEQPRLLCPCLYSLCMQENSDNGSTCPLKCCKPNPGDTRHVSDIANDAAALERFEWTGNPVKKCQCFVCKCQCSKLFYVNDFQRIGLALAQQRAFGSSQETVAPHVQVQNLMGQAFMGGLAAVRDAAATHNETQLQSAHGTNYQETIFNSAAAGVIVRTGGDRLDSSGVGLLQSSFGRNTTVQLPGGESLDVRDLMANNNAHARNNRIGGAANANRRVTFPGMVDNLNPDYSAPSAVFHQAALNPQGMSSALVNTRRAILNTADAASNPNSAPPAASTATTTSTAGDTSSSIYTTAAGFPATNTDPTGDDINEFILQDKTFDEMVAMATRESISGQGKSKTDCIDLLSDDTTPLPPPQYVYPPVGPSNSTDSSTLTAAAPSKTMNAQERRSARKNNAILTFDAAKKQNNKKMRRFRKDLTADQKAEQQVAIKRKKILAEMAADGDDELCDRMEELVASNEKTFSAGPHPFSPATALVRIEAAYGSPTASAEEDSA